MQPKMWWKLLFYTACKNVTTIEIVVKRCLKKLQLRAWEMAQFVKCFHTYMRIGVLDAQHPLKKPDVLAQINPLIQQENP